MGYTTITAAELATLDGLDDWRFILGTIQAEYRAADDGTEGSGPGRYQRAADLVGAIAAAAEAADHHPDIDLRYPDRVRITLTTHATGGLTTADVDLARRISALAASAGATPDPGSAQAVEVAIDTTDPDRIRPFWAAVLGYRDDGQGSLVDPAGSGPSVWFQLMDQPRTERNRFHLDISVAHDQADQRIAQALAAGGHLVSDRRARAFWVLADADGNEACICTWQDR